MNREMPCPKCGGLPGGLFGPAPWRISYCGPGERCRVVIHTIEDPSEHLVVECNVCGWKRVEPCFDAPPDPPAKRETT